MGKTIPIQRESSFESEDKKKDDDDRKDKNEGFLSAINPFKKKKQKESTSILRLRSLNIFAEEPVISVGTPFNVQHNIHVDFNSVTGFEVISDLFLFSLLQGTSSRMGSDAKNIWNF
jgi:hypothetical protein